MTARLGPQADSSSYIDVIAYASGYKYSEDRNTWSRPSNQKRIDLVIAAEKQKSVTAVEGDVPK